MNDIDVIINDAVKPKAEQLAPADVFAKYEHLRISATKPISRPRTILAINGFQIATPGNIVAISGAPKVGKTAITGLILSGAICTSNGYDGSAQIEIGGNAYRKAVIGIDCEQSLYHHYRNLEQGILKRARIEREPENFYSYNIRQLLLSDYRQFTDGIFKAANETHSGIHLAVIDGVADYISSVNDEAEANAILEYFAHLAIKYDTAIFLVVHLNPNSDKERGHLGSQLQRKCESVLTIKKDGDVSVLEGKFLRSGAISECDAIRYKYDTEKGYHVFLESSQAVNNSKLMELANLVFTEPRKYSDAVKLIQDADVCGVRTAKGRIKAMTDAGMLDKNESDGAIYYSLKSSENDTTPF